MKACKQCGSYAINHNHHGRDGADPDLCDVCYWRKIAERKWRRLTEEEIHKLDPLPHVMFDQQRIDFARALEAKLKEKNT